MKLYFFPIAPNPTKVRLYLAEKADGGASIPLEEILVNLPEGEQTTPEHLARNPFGALPVLELDDGSCLIESLSIIEYIEECHPKPAMIGVTAEERARVRQLERIVEGRVMSLIARLVHATRSPLGLPPNPAAAAELEAMLPKGLGYLDTLLADGRAFVAGDAPTIADCTLAAGLQFARFRELDLLGPYSHVARWDRAYRERSAPRSVLSV